MSQIRRIPRLSLPVFTTCFVLLAAASVPATQAPAGEGHAPVPPRQAAPAAAERPAALDALDRYVGHWRSEDKADREGNAFHFEYDLQWFDPARTIAKMLITQVNVDRTTVLFEGFKGLHPDGGVYYVAASPAGRAADGVVRVEQSELVTAYDGWGADGTRVEVRDVFTAPDAAGSAFASRTFVRRSPDAEWQQVGEDHWRRVDS